jgi:predicted nucleotidyltransferase
VVSTLPNASQEALNEILHRDDPSILAVVLTGSAARGTATA